MLKLDRGNKIIDHRHVIFEVSGSFICPVTSVHIGGLSESRRARFPLNRYDGINRIHLGPITTSVINKKKPHHYNAAFLYSKE